MSRRWLGVRPWIWLATLFVLLLFVQQSPLGQQIGPRANLFFAPLVSALQAPAIWWQDISQWFIGRDQLQSEVLDLRKRVQQQSFVEQERDALRAENMQLRSLLVLPELPDYIWHAAKVLGRSPDKMSQRLMLKAQTQIHADDAVASSEGLVGVVDSVSGHLAVVRTILDASLAVPATQPGSGLAVLVRGQGERLLVDFVPVEQAPPVGSVLMTSGSGGIFPPGIPVARIVSIRPVAGSVFAEVEAEPTAHWRRDAWLSIASQQHP
ncbi:MAG: rod shape-determining protein [Zetaproteobacteria bacterium CG12_big_fil_rev_8_21_14_0_65_55_1124]|nr:MAG: rod shape-determining protein [Zetaproteobacteria bacterium CG08_land_8_20_14_0_20_55_17]PIW42816.1 MAG: rod shape-determining protein [Zetaproteobacteria bacterium CG12_big_fil_rev_8_21_14_0_65_55_1124]PIY51628.1 MAG: rod shape-determining protein [Zetaproteobacteria bacterium CG_4_10_14_0_8_um_filter_55_43]PJB80901.1 MAG: rod shape-determining protein [Zetaproteobacteria bacterium CG_4_9_14_0_8_um_filter_55_31]